MFTKQMYFLMKEMQNPCPSNVGHFHIEDADSAESNENSYFRFIVLELLATIPLQHFFVQK